MNIVMIAVHKNGNKIVGFRLLDTDEGKIQDVPSNNVKAVLESNKVTIENLKIDCDRVVGSNGALQRYPSIVNGQLYGKSPLIILFELVNNCYRVTNYMGEIVDIEEQEAIRYANTEGIANGKIVSNDNGEYHISSINGTYKQDKLVQDKKYGKVLVAKMKMLGNSTYTLDENYLATLKNKEAEEVVFGKGVLGIAENGCGSARKLKRVVLPETLETLGKGAFAGCNSLEEIVIPEGVKVIPSRCFAGCSNLKRVTFPNSLRVLDHKAFFGCRKLEFISCGPVKLDIAYNALPSGVKRVRRK